MTHKWDETVWETLCWGLLLHKACSQVGTTNPQHLLCAWSTCISHASGRGSREPFHHPSPWHHPASLPDFFHSSFSRWVQGAHTRKWKRNRKQKGKSFSKQGSGMDTPRDNSPTVHYFTVVSSSSNILSLASYLPLFSSFLCFLWRRTPQFKTQNREMLVFPTVQQHPQMARKS